MTTKEDRCFAKSFEKKMTGEQKRFFSLQADLLKRISYTNSLKVKVNNFVSHFENAMETGKYVILHIAKTGAKALKSMMSQIAEYRELYREYVELVGHLDEDAFVKLRDTDSDTKFAIIPPHFYDSEVEWNQVVLKAKICFFAYQQRYPLAAEKLGLSFVLSQSVGELNLENANGDEDVDTNCRKEDNRSIDDLLDFIDGDSVKKAEEDKKKKRKKNKDINTAAVEKNKKEFEERVERRRSDEQFNVDMQTFIAIAEQEVKDSVKESLKKNDVNNFKVVDNEKMNATTGEVGDEAKATDLMIKNVKETTESQTKELNVEKEILMNSIKNTLKREKEHNNKVKEIIEAKSTEKKNIIISMDKAEDSKNIKMKEIIEVDNGIKELQYKKSVLQDECKKSDYLLVKLSRKQKRLDEYIETQLRKASQERGEIEDELQMLRLRLAETDDNLDQLKSGTSRHSVSVSQSTEQQMVQFLDLQISEKEEELECPVCLEVCTSSPIFMCEEMHLICSTCRPKLVLCPQCRQEFQGPPKRHRFAEKVLVDLSKLKEQRSRLQF